MINGSVSPSVLPLSSSFSILPSWFPGRTTVNVIETLENHTLCHLKNLSEKIYIRLLIHANQHWYAQLKEVKGWIGKTDLRPLRISCWRQIMPLFVIFLHFRVTRTWFITYQNTDTFYTHWKPTESISYFCKQFSISKICMRTNCAHNTSGTPVWFEVSKDSASALGKRINGITLCKARLDKHYLSKQ